MTGIRRVRVAGGIMGVMLVAGCATMPTPQQVRVPTPIQGNSGKYMCPFTSDDTVAEWVDKGVAARFGSAIGGAAGAYAGQKALEQIPFIGGILGQKVGEGVGRQVAISASGGMEFIKKTSDLSFNSIDDVAVYMYAKYTTRPDYGRILQLTQEIYPELKGRYAPAIQRARM